METMATRTKKKTTLGSMKGVSAADFMKKLNGAAGLASLNDKVDEFYPLGQPVVDRALGGGIQKGQMCCLRGAKSTGKSLVSLTIARNVIESGGNVAYFDTENKISQKAILRMGLGKYLNNQFQFLTIDTQKDAIDIILQMIDSGVFQLVVVDSINGLYTEEQAERDIHDESKVGGYQSKVWSEYLPMLTQHAAANDVTIILVQQARDNLQSMYGSTETYSGGKAIEHFATTILRFGSNKKGNDVVNGSIVRQGITIRRQEQPGIAPRCTNRVCPLHRKRPKPALGRRRARWRDVRDDPPRHPRTKAQGFFLLRSVSRAVRGTRHGRAYHHHQRTSEGHGGTHARRSALRRREGPRGEGKRR